MIISKGRSYVFVHIPKTGGTSLAQALEGRAMRDDLLIGDTPKAKLRKGKLKGLSTRGRLWKHSTLADIDGVLAAQGLSRMFTFTMVRNPWDRVFSYYYWLREQTFDHPVVDLANTLPFEAFVGATLVRQSFNTSQARSYMTSASGQEQCQAYIRLEHFDDDAAPLFEHLGFEVDLPHLNRSARPESYHAHYDAKSRDIVAEMCAEDIARFGYRF